MRAAEKSKHQVAHIDLGGLILEGPPEFTLFGDEDAQTLRHVLDRLSWARDDQDLKAVLVTLQPNLTLSLSQAQELREALKEIRETQKHVIVHADSYDTIGYIIATGASDIVLLEGGEIMIPGIAIETMFYKGLFDKLGVRADYVQIGEYKGADEAFTRSGPSEEMRGELNRLTQALYDQLVYGLAESRGVEVAVMRDLVNDAMVHASQAKERGLVDHLSDVDGLRDLLSRKLKGEIHLIRDYGLEEREPIDFSNIFTLMARLTRKPPAVEGPAIALIHVQGMIVDGEGGTGLFGGSFVGSTDLRRAFRIARRDERVKAIVLRIDSPGGSALACEAVWQAARRLAVEKPLVVSIGSMATSGGYYVACAADHIIAEESSIIGSIGVVGGKIVLAGLYEKLGLTGEIFARGDNADLFSNQRPFTDQQRRMVTRWMRNTYEQFTQRVMATRRGKIQDIDQVARGRIFIAGQALELGMIDALGGLNQALNHAAELAELDEFHVLVLPEPRTLADVLSGSRRGVSSPISPTTWMSAGDAGPAVLPKSVRTLLDQQIRLVQELERRPVMLLSPFVITVR